MHIIKNIEGQLAASRWRSKFGRPSKVPRLGDVDPTGSYCLLPEDWLKRKCGMNGVFFDYLFYCLLKKLIGLCMNFY